MQISKPVAVVLLLVAVAVLVGSIMYVRRTNGDDIADQIHADMKKVPKGPPQSFIDSMRKQSGKQ